MFVMIKSSQVEKMCRKKVQGEQKSKQSFGDEYYFHTVEKSLNYSFGDKYF